MILKHLKSTVSMILENARRYFGGRNRRLLQGGHRTYASASIRSACSVRAVESRWWSTRLGVARMLATSSTAAAGIPRRRYTRHFDRSPRVRE